MATERLSKLQKWILIECYKNPSKEVVETEPHTEKKLFTIPRTLIVKNGNISQNSTNSNEVVITRSLNNLAKKGLVDLYGMFFFFKPINITGFKQFNVKNIALTKQGIKKAKSLMLSNRAGEKLNNKKAQCQNLCLEYLK